MSNPYESPAHGEVPAQLLAADQTARGEPLGSPHSLQLGPISDSSFRWYTLEFALNCCCEYAESSCGYAV
jgi:hypothetical protein